MANGKGRTRRRKGGEGRRRSARWQLRAGTSGVKADQEAAEREKRLGRAQEVGRRGGAHSRQADGRTQSSRFVALCPRRLHPRRMLSAVVADSGVASARRPTRKQIWRWESGAKESLESPSGRFEPMLFAARASPASSIGSMSSASGASRALRRLAPALRAPTTSASKARAPRARHRTRRDATRRARSSRASHVIGSAAHAALGPRRHPWTQRLRRASHARAATRAGPPRPARSSRDAIALTRCRIARRGRRV